MGSETDKSVDTVTLRRFNYDEIIEVLRLVYGTGYSGERLTYEERKHLRSRTYRLLKTLGVDPIAQARAKT